MGARAGAVGWGTALQSRRSRVRFPMVSLEFFIDIILPALGVTQSVTEMSTRIISLGSKGGRCVGWQPYHLHVLIVLKSRGLSLFELSGPVQDCSGIALPDKSLARPGRKQARKHVRDCAISTTSRRVLSLSFFFSARQGAEGNSRRSDTNISLFPSWSS